ncbi:MAG: hypothetical protein EXR71_07315 [Myxococcales bacterium]|nr:hypothetical protein [Myxococcales bacterium]
MVTFGRDTLPFDADGLGEARTTGAPSLRGVGVTPGPDCSTDRLESDLISVERAGGSSRAGSTRRGARSAAGGEARSEGVGLALTGEVDSFRSTLRGLGVGRLGSGDATGPAGLLARSGCRGESGFFFFLGAAFASPAEASRPGPSGGEATGSRVSATATTSDRNNQRDGVVILDLGLRGY